MQNDYIDFIEPTPKLIDKKCQILSLFIRIFLQFGTYITTLFAWYMYDYFIAGTTLILSFIIIGIIRSKLRNIAIPITQQEYQYDDKTIADWFVAKEICYKNSSKTTL